MKKVFVLITVILFGFILDLEARPYCKNMSSCAEACDYFLQGYSSLDRDKDGIPCENVCYEPCKAKTKKDEKKKKKHSK